MGIDIDYAIVYCLVSLVLCMLVAALCWSGWAGAALGRLLLLVSPSSPIPPSLLSSLSLSSPLSHTFSLYLLSPFSPTSLFLSLSLISPFLPPEEDGWAID